jgi:serine/threonine-protein kinase
LAATLYKLLTGQEPEAAISRVMGCSLAPPQQLNPNISDVVNQAILQGLELNPENRPQSVQEWLQLLVSTTLADDLKSDKGIDYSRLRDLLAAGDWLGADGETADKMLLVIGKDFCFEVNTDDIKQFPCTDLRTIDRLWVKYSNGHFGFSVQKHIWQEVGGKVDRETEKRFDERVGWRVNNKWLGKSYSELTFSLQAPKGHLPAHWLCYELDEPVAGRGVLRLLSRREL